MKTSISICLVLLLSIRTYAQKTSNDSLAGFDNVHFQEHLSEIKDKTARENYKQSVYRNFIKNKYNLVPEVTYVSKAASTSTCGNFDFEDGNVNGWTMTGDFSIMSGSGIDPFGGFPVVCPGGNFSLRLNDNNTNASTCPTPGTKTTFTSTASRNITISAANSMIKVNLASCFLKFPHTQNDAAFVGIEFFDALNNALAVPTFTAKYTNPPGSIVASMPFVSSTGTVQGLQICGYGTYPVEYMPWQQKQFNLSAYIGQTIKIKLTAAWCLYQYDFGYAYFDVCCDNACQYVGPTSKTTNQYYCYALPFTNTICTNYPGNMNYQWYGPSGPISTATCIPVNSYGTYTLVSNHFASPTFSYNEVFTFTNNPTISFSLASSYCNSSSGIPLFASPSGGTFSGPNVTGNTFTPSSPGTYSITYSYTNSSGCSGTLTQTTSVTSCATGIKSYGKDQRLTIAPNPFNSEITIGVNDLPENSEFILFNTLGQEIIRKRLSEGKNSIETEALPPGLYIYSLLSQNKQVKQGKLVKE